MLTEYQKKLIDEYKELTDKITSPELSKTINYQDVSERIAYLSPIIEVISEIQKKEQELIEIKELQKDQDLKQLAEQEQQDLQKKVHELQEKLHFLMIEPDPDDKRNAIIEIRAGTGGEEAALFAGDLYRMYIRYAEKNGWKVEQLSSNKIGLGGFKEIITLIAGKNVYQKLKFENGVHRVQRVPETESSGRIHTSTASVVVLPEIDDVEVDINPDDLRIDVYRAGGPGGQSVNTTDSAVRITHIPSSLVVTCQDQKSQHKNKARAMSILKSRLYDIEKEKQLSQTTDKRQSAIRGGARSAKIRTYNFPQSRITDHRIKKNWHNIATILDGDLDELINETQTLIS